jgi:hypothetical protein
VRPYSLEGVLSVSNYPTPYNPSHTGEPAGPGPRGTSPCGYILQELPPEYPGMVEKVMVDGGSTRGADTTNKVRRFLLIYTGLTSAQAKVLDDHRAEANDTLLGFSFRYYRPSMSIDELLSDVHYQSFEYPPHQSYNDQSRTVTLIKRPA